MNDKQWFVTIWKKDNTWDGQSPIDTLWTQMIIMDGLLLL